MNIYVIKYILKGGMSIKRKPYSLRGCLIFHNYIYIKMIKKQVICLITVFLFFYVITSADAICQYANNAQATDQAPNYEAIYSTGPPGGDGDCSTSPSLFTSWMAQQQDGSEEITLTFPNAIYPTDLTIFGDYELCIDRAWLWRDNAWYLFMNDLTQVTTPGCTRHYNIS